MTQLTAVPQRRNVALWALAIAGVGLLGILPLTLLSSGKNPAPAPTTAVLDFDRVRIAYFEFGMGGDTLWAADPASPADRIRLATIAHAPEYGIIPALSPDSRSFAYTVLPPDTPAPAPDAPAQVWLASLTGGEPRLLASNADLLVPPAWSPDGSEVVFRRSNGATTALYAVSTATGAERLLAESGDALFPAGFPNAGNMLYVRLSDAGSVLYQAGLTGGAGTEVTALSAGLTRDWALSPDGTKLAYLEMTFTGQVTAARAAIYDLTTGERSSVGATDADAFNPAWDEDGRLTIGQLRAGAASTAAHISFGDAGMLSAPVRGFDVPLASTIAAGTAVTSFDGTTITNPGRARLVVVDPAGVRQEIATGEVTFLGWIHP